MASESAIQSAIWKAIAQGRVRSGDGFDYIEGTVEILPGTWHVDRTIVLGPNAHLSGAGP